MTEQHFETPRPVDLLVAISSGSVHVRAGDTTTTTVLVTGRDAERVTVRQEGDAVEVVAPRHRTGFLAGDSSLRVEVVVPDDSDATVRTGAATIGVEGPIGSVRLRSGSGDVRIETLARPSSVETGSGDVRVAEARAMLHVKSGSGDVLVDHAAGLAASTGSGDVVVQTSTGPVAAKTGSGDLTVGTSGADVSLTTGSGSLVVRRAARGRVVARGASGDVHVGIPAGVPVWTDISTLSGEIRSGITRVGEPQEGADHVELLAETVSGDVVLSEVAS